MAGTPVGFPVPQMQEGLDDREALDCFILDYIDYCTVMGWFVPKDGCKYDSGSEAGVAQWKKSDLCMSTLRATLPPRMKRLINPSNKTLGLSVTDNSNPVKVLQALIKRFGGSVSVQAERTKMGRMFQTEGESISAWECRVVERAKYCEYGDFEDQACRDRFIAGLVDETLQGKLNTNGHRNKEGVIVAFRTVVEIAKNYESSTDAKRLMRQVRGDQEQVNWADKTSRWKGKNPQPSADNQRKGLYQNECNYCGARPSHPREKCRAVILKYMCRNCGKEGHVARKCMRRPQNVNAVDESGSPCEQNVYHLFTLDIHSVRAVSVKKGKKFFAAIKLSAAKNHFVWKTLQLDTASTTNTLAVEDLWSMCPVGFDVNSLIQPSRATLHTYGGGVITPVGQVELVCETQGKCYPLEFQLLSKRIMGSQPPLLSGSDCVKLGLIEIKGSTSLSVPSAQNSKDMMVHQLQSSAQGDSDSVDGDITASTLQNTTAQELTSGVSDPPSSIDPVAPNGGDESIAAVGAEKKPIVSSGNQFGVPRVPVPWGKLTKGIVLEVFKDVHTGLGTLGPPLHISMNPNVTPVQAHPHRCPVAKEPKVAEAIRDMEKQGILKKVTEPTAWISNSVYREKPDGSLRVCIDPSQTINKAIEVPKYPIPTVDELLPKLSNAKIFSCVDVYKGFSNIVLDESSSFLTTMHTPIGRYRWLRMPFGVSLGPEEYQRRQHEVLEGLKGVVNKADDILVFGSGETVEEAEKDHDMNLWNLMLRCKEVNLKLNPKKFQFKVKEVTWMGHLLSGNGVAPHPDRVQAIVDMNPPQDVKGVQRFLGMCNYLSRFTPNLAEIVKPLTELTHVNAVWSWSSQHDQAFKEAKRVIANATTLRYFDVNKPCVLQVDASDTGLGGALLQEGQPVAFTSSTLSATEINYAPIEKECLAIKVACTKFYQYLYSKQDVVVHSDHQPLETIFKKPLRSAPKRLQRMMLQLQPFKFTVVYKKGKYMYLADTLSRAALKQPAPSGTQEEVFQCYSGDAQELFRAELESLELDSPEIQPSTLEEIRVATQGDRTLSALCQFVAHGWPPDKSHVPTVLRHYYPCRDELAVYHGVVYKSHKVIIPLQLQSTMVRKLHQGHQGGESMVRRAREVMYWPGMRAAILQESANCSVCASYSSSLPKEPMLSHEIPHGPWKFISQDLFKQGGRWYAVTVDHYSDWFEVDLLNEDITAAHVISVTKAHFARYGVPDKFLSDNGPQYVSQEFVNFAKAYDFQLITPSPYYARATGKAEAAVKEAKKMLKKSDLLTGLLEHRNTPPQGMTFSPAQRFLCRRTNSSLPVSESLLRQSVPPVTVVRDEHLDRRAKAKAHYDKTASKELAPLIPGQYVYSKPNDHHRGERWNFGEVLNEVTPRSYLIKTPDGLVRRNRTHLRPAEAARSCNRQPLTQQAVPTVGQQDMPTSDSPVVPPPTPDEAVPTTDRSVGATPSPVESPVQKSRYGRPIRPPQRLDL